MPWTGTIAANGYGVLTVDGARLYAHRVAHETETRPLEPGELVRHSCDNPPCVNPAHLSRGTPLDNTRDKMERGRHLYGVASPAHRLTEDEVRDIRARHAQGELSAHLAREHGVWQKTVTMIVRRQTWARLTD